MRPSCTAALRIFGLLAGLRLAWMKPEDALPMPFADRLVAAYLGVERKPARAAINALCDHGVIEHVDRMGERGPYLFEPGPA